MTPKAVVFDLGKVLVDFDYIRAARRIAARCRHPLRALAEFPSHLALLQQLEHGDISDAAFFETLVQKLGYSGSFEQFSEEFGDIFTEIPEMTALQATLHAHNIPTYVLSNTNNLAVTHIRKTYPFFSRFNGYTYSFEEHSLKPDAKIYEALEHKAALAGADILYYDDRPENVEAALQRGWQGVVHETPKSSVAAAKQRGLPTP
jgi:FMN phosphatase YigB (HAD superfamily)